MGKFDSNSKNLLQTMQEIGKAIKECRKAKGLSQAALSSLAGVNVAHIRRLESGNGNVRILICLKIAEAMDLTLSGIVRDSESE